MFSKKYALVHNTLAMKPVYGYSDRVELAQDYARSIKPLIPTLEQNGIKTTLITKAQIIRSGLSHVTHKDIEPIPYLLGWDMWTHAIEAINNQNPCLSIVYYSGVDNLGHKYGAYSKEITFELSSIEHSLRNFIESLSREVKDETLLIVTGDHGIAEIKQSYYLQDYPELMQHLLLPPVGDGRATYLFCKNDRREAFAQSFEKQIEGFKLYPTDELIERGLFGEPIDKEGLKERIGDFTALSKSDTLLEYPYFEADREHPQKGAHGGMTAEEMVVPLLSAKLSNL
jgi:predicted AlkP superfamily pyrophosphatase or phosphodiesterase